MIRLVSLLILFLNAHQILTQVCYSSDDPHMRTIDGTPFEFHYDGSHFILYTDFKETRVTAGFQKCAQYSNARCNCAIYVKKANTIAFIDFCQTNEYNRPFNRFYTVSEIAENTYGPGAVKQMTCQPILPIQENDQQIWNAIVPANQFFKCAKIGDGAYVTYVLKTYDPRVPGDSVSVRVNIGTLSMPSVTVTAAQNSFKNTGGLCGMWNNDKNKDLYVLDSNLAIKYTTNTVELKEFWRLDSKWTTAQAGKRCPECFIKAEKRLYCPCDEKITFDDNSNDPFGYCNVAMPNCIEKSLNLPPTPINNSTINPSITTTTTTGRPPITPEQALQLCSNAILNHPGLKPLINAGVFDPSIIIENCVQDLVLTLDLGFINMHLELALIQALQNVLINEIYYINGTITEAGVQLLLGLCPSGCSGNGQCLINPDCLNVRNKNLIEIANCLSPVYCNCNTNFGGPNCALNIQDVPDFFLSQTCCDIRNYKCDTISGYGYPFARKTKLHYKIIFSETDNVNVFDNFVTGLANVIDENEFTVNLPLHTLWRQNTSVVDVSIGISYDNKKFKYQQLQLFDSICRECDGEVSNEVIKPETCLIDNKCYVDGQEEFNNEDNICDTTNPFEWTFIGYIPPTCNNSTHLWSPWYNLDDPSGDGDIEILTLKKEFKCDVSAIEVFTVDDVPIDKVKNQIYYKGKEYGFICLNKDQQGGVMCLDYKIRQCCAR